MLSSLSLLPLQSPPHKPNPNLHSSSWHQLLGWFSIVVLQSSFSSNGRSFHVSTPCVPHRSLREVGWRRVPSIVFFPKEGNALFNFRSLSLSRELMWLFQLKETYHNNNMAVDEFHNVLIKQKGGQWELVGLLRGVDRRHFGHFDKSSISFFILALFIEYLKLECNFAESSVWKRHSKFIPLKKQIPFLKTRVFHQKLNI